MVDSYVYKGRHRQNRLGNFSLKLGVLFTNLLATTTAAMMKHTQIAPAASLKPDKAGNLRTDDVQELTANTLNYLGEQTSLSVVAAGSIAALACIGGIAFTKRAHNRTKQAEKQAAQAERQAILGHRAARLKTMVKSAEEMGKQTTALIAWSRAVEFPDRAMELEATRPKTFPDMAPLAEIITLVQANCAIPIREEPFYSQDATDSETTQLQTPMSRTVYRSIAAFRQYRDEEATHDTGYHAPLNIEQFGVHDLMPDLLAAPSVGDPHPTAAYPLVAQAA